MEVLYLIIPIALLIALIFVVMFMRNVFTGQYDDLETPAQRMLFEDESIKESKLK